MARSSYAETRSRSSVIFWTNVLFIIGIGLLASVVGYAGPSILHDYGSSSHIEFSERLIWALGAVAVLVSLFFGKLLLMGSDGNKIAKSMGGTLIDPIEGAPQVYTDRKHNQQIQNFLHFVETCALAAGISDTPKAYILFDEPGLNAFAAGNGHGKTVVAITEGALLAFDNEELEGVVGHEVAHIVQGDTQFAVRIIALCTALMIAAEIGWFLMRMRSGRDNRIAVLGVIVGLTGIFGTLCARMMQAYTSRQAEYRADAAGSLYAGTTRGLESALRKIQRQNTGEIGTKIPPAYAHMMLAPPGAMMSFGQRIASLSFATHPPTKDRIAALRGAAGRSKTNTSPETPETATEA